MSDPIRRVCVLTDWATPDATVDLALPTALRTSSLIPLIVDIVEPADINESAAWALLRVGGRQLDESLTLVENGIEDGDLLLLAPADSVPSEPVRNNPGQVVAVNSGTGDAKTDSVGRLLAALCASAAGVMVLTWPAAGSGVVGAATAAVLGSAAAAGALLAQRVITAPQTPVTAFGGVSVMMAATAGYLAVPGGPATPNYLLAAAASTAVSVLLLRITRGDTVTLTAIASCSALLAAALAATSGWAPPIEVTGTALATAALIVLSAAPRLSIAVAGLSPRISLTENGIEDDPPGLDNRLALGNRFLSGLVLGTCGATTLGAILVAVGSRGTTAGSWAAAFTGAVGLALTLRGRCHADALRRAALKVAGIGCLATTLALVVSSQPGLSVPAGTVTLLAASTGLWPNTWEPTSPLLRRAVDGLEYLALAAAVPLACGVIGLYGLVRGLSLP